MTSRGWKDLRNALLITTGTLPWLFKGLGTILDVVGMAETAISIGGYLSVIDAPRLNWDAVWLLVSYFSIVYLILVNRSYLKRKYTQIKGLDRVWSMTARQAVQYMVSESQFRDSFPEKGRGMAAIEALMDHARKGRIKLAGRKPGEHESRPIRKRDLANLKFDPGSIVAAEHGGGTIVRRDNESARIEFEGVRVDGSQVRDIWPKAPRRSISG